MSNFFLTFTPYHILLASAIALHECRGENNHLVVRPSFQNSQILISILANWKGSPYKKITHICGLHGITNVNLRRGIQKLNSLAIRRMVIKEDIKRVYVGPDASPEAQAALHFSKISNCEVRGIHFEDGSSAYSTANFPEREEWKIRFGKLFYGSWWDYIRVHGTSRWIDEARLVYPEFVRPELADKLIRVIEHKMMLALGNELWPVKYLSKLGVSVEALQSIDGLLILPRASLVGGVSSLTTIVKKIVDCAKKHSQRVGIKFHPRDIAQNLPIKDNGKNVLFLPNTIPVELLYIYLANQLRFVIAGVSTSLMTAQWLLDKSQIICVTEFTNLPDSRILDIFRTLCIKVVATPTDIDIL